MKKINYLLLYTLYSFIWSYSDNPENELVGAPQQNTCNLCHSNSALLYDENAFISISGLPQIINPGDSYDLDITVRNQFAEIWGFEIAAILGGNGFGSNPGATLIQAGNFNDIDSSTAIIEEQDGVEYVKHTSEGNYAGTTESATWSISWIAPQDYYGNITFYAAGVAGNNDLGNLGDFVYTTSITREITYDYPEPLNVNYQSDIKPIFNFYCVACHNEQEQYNDNGLILTDGFGRTSYENLILGGNNGSPVIPFNYQESLLFQVLDHSIYPNNFEIAQMPYFSFQIPENLLEIIKVWIDEGATSFSCIPGDYNLDSILNVLDVVGLVSCIVDDNCDNMQCLDLNNDELLNVQDIVLLINLILN